VAEAKGRGDGPVLVVDDDHLYAQALARLITGMASRLVAMPASLDGVREAADGVGVDAAVVRVRDSSDARLREALALLGGDKGARVVLVAADAGRIDGDLAGMPGVAGTIPASAGGEELAEAVERARRGLALGNEVDCSAPRPPVKKGHSVLAMLTAREREVVELIAAGGSAGQAADVLNISPQTVRTHVQSVMAKLAVHSQTEMVWVARQFGLHPDRARAGVR